MVKEFLKQLPDYNILYFGDTARNPYGSKSRETIIKYSLEDAEILLRRGARVLVVACNSAASAAYTELKQRFPGIPIFEVVGPAVKKAGGCSPRKRIGLIGTRATIASGIYERLLKNQDRQIQVFAQACPLLVPLVEEGWLGRPEAKRIIKKYLTPLKVKQIDSLILGCTHYPLLKKDIQLKIGKRVQLVDSAMEVVHEFKDFLKNNPDLENDLAKGGVHKFIISDSGGKFASIATAWLGQKTVLEKIDVK